MLRPKRAVAHFGESGDGLAGTISVEQKSPWSSPTLSVDVVGNRTLDAFFISQSPPAIGTDFTSGAPVFRCPSSLVFNPPSTSDSRARRGNGGAGFLTGQVGGLRCGNPNSVAGWFCNSDGTTLDPTRTRRSDRVGLSTFGTNSIVGRAVVVVRPITDGSPFCSPLTVEDPFNNASVEYSAIFHGNDSVHGEVKVVEAVDSALAETTVFANLSSPNANSLQLTYTGTEPNVCVIAVGLLTCIGARGQALTRNTGDVIDIPLTRLNDGFAVDSVRIQVFPNGSPNNILATATLDTACVSGSELATGPIPGTNNSLSVRTTPCRDWFVARRSSSPRTCGSIAYNPYVLSVC